LVGPRWIYTTPGALALGQEQELWHLAVVRAQEEESIGDSGIVETCEKSIKTEKEENADSEIGNREKRRNDKKTWIRESVKKRRNGKGRKRGFGNRENGETIRKRGFGNRWRNGKGRKRGFGNREKRRNDKKTWIRESVKKRRNGKRRKRGFVKPGRKEEFGIREVVQDRKHLEQQKKKRWKSWTKDKVWKTGKFILLVRYS
jgi:hypothetical protein